MKEGRLKRILAVIIIVSMILSLGNGLELFNIEVKAADAFETSISGFPDSYKVYLRQLHKNYPNWKFVPDNTGIDFATAVENEASNNRSLIENSYSKYLKSNATGDYNVTTGKYIAKDGATWVSASKNCVAYFMDPRNFLDAEHIYMFETLSYDSSTQTQAGVEAILKGSFMYNTTMGYLTSDGKYIDTDIKYSQQIMTAAKNSKVSAYHIASKILQEMGTKKHSKYAGMGASGSISGEYTGYPGIYNFYNIGATSGANPIANGLSWAKTGKTYQRPWNTPQKSISGGAQYLGEKFINAGQNTMYLQRFNVKKNGTYSLYEHQYMTNISGAASEAASTSDAYKELGIVANAKTFIIPVFDNMPNETNTLTLGKKGNKTGVVSSRVNVRKGPSTAYGAVTSLASGQAVTITGIVQTDIDFGTRWLSNPYWYNIKFTQNGKSYTGYVSAAYINVNPEYTIAKKGKIKLNTSLKTTEKVFYMSDNPAVATVDNLGNVTGVGAGEVTIRVYTGAGIVAVSSIKVLAKSIPATAITLNKTSLTLTTGTNEKLKATVTPSNSTDAIITWSSSNKKVASVTQAGKVKAKGIGTCTITAKTANNKTVKCTVKVVPQTVTVTALSKSYNSTTITWTQPESVTGYWIYRRVPGGKYKTIATVSGSICSYTDKKLVTGQTYYYKVKAYKKVGSVKYKSSKSKASKTYPKPAKAKISSIKATSKGAKITWKKVSGASGYIVYRSEGKNGTYVKVKQIKKQSKKSYNNTGLLNGKTYYYKVVAYRNVAEKYIYGDLSNAKKIKK